MQGNKRGLICLLILSMALLIVGCGASGSSGSAAEYRISGSSTSTSQEQTNSLLQAGYDVVEAYRGDYIVEFKTSGFATYMNYAYLSWDNYDDRYDEVLVKMGQSVKKGDVLATFEVTSVSEADIMAANLSVEETRERIGRIQEQYEAQIAGQNEALAGKSGSEYDIASLQLAQTKNEYAQQLSAAQHQLEQQQKQLTDLLKRRDDNKLVAPFDGVVIMVSRDFRKGDRVDAGTLITVGDSSSRVISVPDQSTAPIPYLAEVEVTAKNNNTTVKGTVISCPSIGGGGAVLIKPEGGITDEMADVYYEVQGVSVTQKDVLLLSSSAIRKEGERYYVNVLGEGGIVIKVYVNIAATQNGVSWISDGLEEGQQVVVG